jgi:hypothetical protein
MIVHQMLHGYENGHRLLASSLPRNIPTSPEGQRAILILSDISGPGAGEEFDGMRLRVRGELQKCLGLDVSGLTRCLFPSTPFGRSKTSRLYRDGFGDQISSPRREPGIVSQSRGVT